MVDCFSARAEIFVLVFAIYLVWIEPRVTGNERENISNGAVRMARDDGAPRGANGKYQLRSPLSESGCVGKSRPSKLWIGTIDQNYELDQNYERVPEI